MAQMVRNPPAVWETWVPSWDRKIPWRRERQPIPVFMPGESHGQGSLVGYSAWGRKESDITEQLSLSFHGHFPPNWIVCLFPGNL